MKSKRERVPLIPGWTVEETAQFLATTPRQIYELAAQGRIPHRKIGSKLLFRPAELEAWLESLPGVSVEGALERGRMLATWSPARGEHLAPTDGEGRRNHA